MTPNLQSITIVGGTETLAPQIAGELRPDVTAALVSPSEAGGPIVVFCGASPDRGARARELAEQGSLVLDATDERLLEDDVPCMLAALAPARAAEGLVVSPPAFVGQVAEVLAPLRPLLAGARVITTTTPVAAAATGAGRPALAPAAGSFLPGDAHTSVERAIALRVPELLGVDVRLSASPAGAVGAAVVGLEHRLHVTGGALDVADVRRRFQASGVDLDEGASSLARGLRPSPAPAVTQVRGVPGESGEVRVTAVGPAPTLWRVHEVASLVRALATR